MKLGKITLALVGLIVGLFMLAFPVKAVDIPGFPSCTSPTGSVKVSYDSGIHGIPGESGQYIGSDIVYTVSDSTLVQCFCAVSGSGIQTNWWKQNSLTQDQIDQLQKLGWIFIPDGSTWGLDPVPYLAQNTSFNCRGGGQSFSQPGPGPAPICDSAKPGTPSLLSVSRSGASATLTWTAVPNTTHYTLAYGLVLNDYIYGVPNTGNVTTYTVGQLDPSRQYYFAVRAVNNCMPGDFATLSIGGQVLGLATTGNSVMIYSLIVLGILLLVLSWLKNRNQNRA